jgi:hypothetical protein
MRCRVTDRHRSLTRRRFVKILLAGSFLAVPVVGALRLWLGSPVLLLRRVMAVELDRSAPVGLLEPNEMATITRLAGVLVPADTTPGASSGWAHEHVNRTTSTRPGYLKEYRAAVRLLDESAVALTPSSSPFHLLSAAVADELLTKTFGWRRTASTWRGRMERLTASGRRRERCWEFVIHDLLQGFYRTSSGWAVVGYDSYPGVPGDPRAYTSLPATLSDGAR